MIKALSVAIALAWFITPAMATDDPIDAAIAAERMPTDRTEDAWRKPADILRFMEIAPGQHALDFYSGPGYYSELMARVVGPSGSVILYNNMLYEQAAHHDLVLRLARKRLPNARTLNQPSNFLTLTPESLDRVLFMLVYHDLYWWPRESPEPMGDAQKVLKTLKDALKPGGLVVVVDHIADQPTDQTTTEVANRMHRIDPKVVRADFAKAGFEFAGESDVLRHATDDHTKGVFNPAVRHRTDQFVYKFRKK
jgi:predicted methyltransferase